LIGSPANQALLGDVNVTASAVVTAVQAYAKINAAGENTISVVRPVMPALKPSDGKQMVCFTLDESDPRSQKTD
jgi:hypothetical protein